ncbi:MAG: ATP-binding protein, partial [Aestuariivita sp.]|nr:ATP-binding protein [Aestuariivita sp.]
MSEFKRIALQRFVNRPEKSEPPIFVGRGTIINKVFTIAQEVGDDRVGIPGNTTVIQGAPGAGKSSVLHHLTHTNDKDDEPKTLVLSSVELEN